MKIVWVIGLLFSVVLLAGCVGESSAVLNLVKDNPLDKAKELVAKSYNSPGKLNEGVAGFTDSFSFSGVAVAEGNPIAADQICFSAGEFAGTGEFTVSTQTPGQILSYTGTGTNAKIKVVCNINGNYLIADIGDLGLTAGNTIANCTFAEPSGRKCLVFLAKP